MADTKRAPRSAQWAILEILRAARVSLPREQQVDLAKSVHELGIKSKEDEDGAWGLDGAGRSATRSLLYLFHNRLHDLDDEEGREADWIRSKKLPPSPHLTGHPPVSPPQPE